MGFLKARAYLALVLLVLAAQASLAGAVNEAASWEYVVSSGFKGTKLLGEHSINVECGFIGVSAPNVNSSNEIVNVSVHVVLDTNQYYDSAEQLSHDMLHIVSDASVNLNMKNGLVLFITGKNAEKFKVIASSKYGAAKDVTIKVTVHETMCPQDGGEKDNPSNPLPSVENASLGVAAAIAAAAATATIILARMLG